MSLVSLSHVYPAPGPARGILWALCYQHSLQVVSCAELPPAEWVPLNLGTPRWPHSKHIPDSTEHPSPAPPQRNITWCRENEIIQMHPCRQKRNNRKTTQNTGYIFKTLARRHLVGNVGQLPHEGHAFFMIILILDISNLQT